MALVVRENWAEAMLPILHTVFTTAGKDEKNYIKLFSNVQKSKLQSERTFGLGEIGPMVEWTGQTAFDEVVKGWPVLYVHKKFNQGVKVERDWIEDQQYSQIYTQVTGLRTAGYVSQQIHFHSTFNNAWYTANKGPDGVPLASDAHRFNENNPATWDNTILEELSSAALEKARTKVMRWKDDKGNPRLVNPDTLYLFVPPELREEALVITKSPQQPHTADNNINIWHGTCKVVESRWLLDPKAWFLIIGHRAKDYLRWWDRRPIGLSKHVQWDTEHALFRIIGRWCWGWDDASFVICGHPSPLLVPAA